METSEPDGGAPDGGACPHCGHMNQADWQLCDACGQRLPWAKTLPPKKPISELSTEELQVLFAPPRQPPVSFLTNRATRNGILVVVLAIASLLYWLR